MLFYFEILCLKVINLTMVVDNYASAAERNFQGRTDEKIKNNRDRPKCLLSPGAKWCLRLKMAPTSLICF